MKVKLHAIFHRALAALLGNFWTQCERCDRYFGGHQKYTKTVYCEEKKKNFRIVCHHCARQLLP